MATAKPSAARARTRAWPIRCAPPVTSATLGIGGSVKSPADVRPGSASPALTPLPSLLPRPHLGAGYIACRDASPSCGGPPGRTRRTVRPGAAAIQPIERKPEIGLLESADLVAQPRRLFEFELGGSLAHAFFKIGDDRL